MITIKTDLYSHFIPFHPISHEKIRFKHVPSPKNPHAGCPRVPLAGSRRTWPFRYGHREKPYDVYGYVENTMDNGGLMVV